MVVTATIRIPDKSHSLISDAGIINHLDNSAANMTYGRVLRDMARGLWSREKKVGLAHCGW